MFGFGKKLLVTHDGGFHADDVFACAVLQIYLDRIGKGYKIIRTRDPKIIERADYVFDVGGVYDANLNRFDHHQKGRAGARENGIMYAAAGLVWKHFGEKVSGNTKTAALLDKKIFESLDAADNGQDLSKSLYGDTFPYSASSMVGIFNLSWKEEDKSPDPVFLKLVKIAKELLKREIEQTNVVLESEKDIKESYEKSEDKRVIVLEKPYSRPEILRVLVQFSEPLYFIYPKSNMEFWKIEAVRISFDTFELRKPFPEPWRGLSNADFQKASGVVDAEFAHDRRFYCTAKSLNGVKELAQKALNS